MNKTTVAWGEISLELVPSALTGSHLWVCWIPQSYLSPGFETGSHSVYSRLVWNPLCYSGWGQTVSWPPASASQRLGLKGRATVTGGWGPISKWQMQSQQLTCEPVLFLCSGFQPRRGESMDGPLHGTLASAGECFSSQYETHLCWGSASTSQTQPQISAEG